MQLTLILLAQPRSRWSQYLWSHLLRNMISWQRMANVASTTSWVERLVLKGLLSPATFFLKMIQISSSNGWRAPIDSVMNPQAYYVIKKKVAMISRTTKYFPVSTLVPLYNSICLLCPRVEFPLQMHIHKGNGSWCFIFLTESCIQGNASLMDNSFRSTRSFSSGVYLKAWWLQTWCRVG